MSEKELCVEICEKNKKLLKTNLLFRILKNVAMLLYILSIFLLPMATAVRRDARTTQQVAELIDGKKSSSILNLFIVVIKQINEDSPIQPESYIAVFFWAGLLLLGAIVCIILNLIRRNSEETLKEFYKEKIFAPQKIKYQVNPAYVVTSKYKSTLKSIVGAAIKIIITIAELKIFTKLFTLNGLNFLNYVIIIGWIACASFNVYLDFKLANITYTSKLEYAKQISEQNKIQRSGV